jgi:hypothetical protein
MMRSPERALVVALLAFCFARAAPAATLAPVEYGIDRSNMSTQWTLAWPQEPKITPFLAAEYNRPGDFEARRVAVMDVLFLRLGREIAEVRSRSRPMDGSPSGLLYRGRDRSLQRRFDSGRCRGNRRRNTLIR